MKTILTAAIVAIMTISGAYAQWQPSGPIKFLIGFRAGGGADTMSRLIAEALEAEYGWTVIPENLDGSSGAVMARAIKGAQPDGLTLGFGTTSTFTFNVLEERDPGYGVEDFDYVATLAGTQMGAVAKADRGWKNLSEAIAAAKSGEEISFGTMTDRLNTGTYYIGKVNDVKFNIVSSFSGGRPVLNAIIADDIDIGWAAGIQQRGVKSGELVNLVNAEEYPLRISPDAETLEEVGVEFYFGETFVSVAPKGIPDDARKAITDAIFTVVKKPGTKLNKYMTEVFTLKLKAGKDANKFINRELANNKKMLKAIKG